MIGVRRTLLAWSVILVAIPSAGYAAQHEPLPHRARGADVEASKSIPTRWLAAARPTSPTTRNRARPTPKTMQLRHALCVQTSTIPKVIRKGFPSPPGWLCPMDNTVIRTGRLSQKERLVPR